MCNMLNVLQQHQFEFAAALIDHQSAHKQFLRKLTKTSKISPQLALDIYRNNTSGVRLQSLQMIYPVCRKILGDKTYRLIVQQYVIEDTEASSQLNYFGASFNLYLKSLLEVGRLPEEYAYLSDLAMLEHKLHVAYYADSDPVFPFQLFEQKINNNQQVYFKLSSALDLIASEYPVYEIWRSNKKKQGAKDVEPIAGKQYLLVYRNEYKSSIAVIDYNEYNILKAIINGLSLQKMTNKETFDIGNVLPILIANKWITGIR